MNRMLSFYEFLKKSPNEGSFLSRMLNMADDERKVHIMKFTLRDLRDVAIVLMMFVGMLGLFGGWVVPHQEVSAFLGKVGGISAFASIAVLNISVLFDEGES